MPYFDSKKEIAQKICHAIKHYKNHEKVALMQVQNQLMKPNLDIDYIDEKSPEHGSMLFNAACFGNLPIMKLLLEKKPDVNKCQEGGYGLTPLMTTIVMENGHLDCVKELLKQPGIQINAQDSKGYTALMHAVEKGNVEIVKTLLGAGAEMNGYYTFGYNEDALWKAVKNGYPEIVELLLNVGADVNYSGWQNLLTEAARFPKVLQKLQQHDVRGVQVKDALASTTLITDTASVVLGYIGIFKKEEKPINIVSQPAVSYKF